MNVEYIRTTEEWNISETDVEVITATNIAFQQWKKDNNMCKLLILNSLEDSLVESYPKNDKVKDI